MKKSMLFASLFIVAFQFSHAELKPLANQELQAVEAQSAATINWSLSLNQTSPGVFANATGEYCNGTDVKFCRLAMSFNNRTTSDGKKQWLVLKGIQGTIGLNNVDIDGVDLLYSSDSNMTGVPDQIKAALQLSIKETSPILIRNFGFNAMSIETDTVANEGSEIFQVIWQWVQVEVEIRLMPTVCTPIQQTNLTKVVKRVSQG